MNKNFLNLFASVGLAASTLLGAGVASAQWQGPEAQWQGRHGEWQGRQPAHETVDTRPAPPPFAMRPVAVRKTATVATIAYRGRAVRSMTLTDGSTVMLASANRSLARTLRPGSLVRVNGFALPANPRLIQRATVTALRAPAAAPAPRPFAMQGTIRSIALGRDGRPDAVRLSNGARIVIPDAVARTVGQLRRGQLVAVTGHRAGTSRNAPYIASAVLSTSGFGFNMR